MLFSLLLSSGTFCVTHLVCLGRKLDYCLWKALTTFPTALISDRSKRPQTLILSPVCHWMQIYNKCNSNYGKHLYRTIQSLSLSRCAYNCPSKKCRCKIAGDWEFKIKQEHMWAWYVTLKINQNKTCKVLKIDLIKVVILNVCLKVGHRS